MYKTILVPIDLSHPETAGKILETARVIGEAGSRVVLLHVLPEIPPFVAAELPEGALKKTMEEALAELRALGENAGAEAEVRHGHTSTAILRCAEEIGADLIIVASHRPGLQDCFLGSTAARVVRHARCAVLVDR